MRLELLELGEWLAIGLAGCVLAWGMMRKCPRCKGNKTLYNTDGTPVLCPECKGSGEVDE